ncbi:hypothetical protein [Rhizobium ruizarguesonis]|uniref:hypothetical protein n=1 Tax=Rhizobium ruizarguesonis TaxID=2081791 RepID=UPI00102F490C|nr:hypothetical protein [Rhizobium ruizarguesonis]NEI08183.1 hypothetical protein [Rhizobium ruizarguesonis]TAT83308.1 hypothetical protein ELI52_07300 [Rhizobium ruizarguesonis]TAU30887.1 hypothetical protein ELI47_07195 [Rhizobium ruizarguesonis]TAW21036.1 hypothetical protein ELI20_07320 [Rhizobium ruizarguesonis]
MSDVIQAGRDEARWPPVMAIMAVSALLEVLPHHVYAMPRWVSYAVLVAAIVPMIMVTVSTDKAMWLRIEHVAIMLLASVYAGNTAAELGDMVGIITVHPPETRSVSLLTSSFTIWITNVLTFSLLYWQIDAGGPSRIARGMAGKPDWLFPQASAPELASPDWRPLYIDYLSLAFNTATAFSPTDVLPLARRAKGLMMLESAISLLTLVLVAARAVNVIP